jgi:hypothetical protein
MKDYIVKVVEECYIHVQATDVAEAEIIAACKSKRNAFGNRIYTRAIRENGRHLGQTLLVNDATCGDLGEYEVTGLAGRRGGLDV